MEDKWVKVTVDQIKADRPNSIAMGPFGSRITRDNFVPKGVPVIRGNNLNDDRFGNNDFVYLTEQKADELRASNAFPDDIVITHRGTLGQVGIIPSNAQYPRYVVSQSQMKLTVDPSLADPHFVFYFFKSPQGQQALLANTSQTGVPAIAQPTTSLRAIQLDLPPLAQQRTIASILGALDDKIELNRQMNQTLEGIAQALFKSWFVDFDPVRAKMANMGLAGSRSSAYEHLFPSSMEESYLGLIPTGWSVGVLEEVASAAGQAGVDPGLVDETTPYIGLQHMPRHSIALAEWGFAKDVTSIKLGFKQGDILFGRLRPYFHKVGVAPLNGVCSSDILPIRACRKEWFGLVLGHVSSEAFVTYTDAVSTGTRMPRVKWGDMARYEIVLPPRNLADAFTDLIWPLVDRIRANIHESKTLADVRDTLLPKLLSGELPVKDFEKATEALL